MKWIRIAALAVSVLVLPLGCRKETPADMDVGPGPATTTAAVEKDKQDVTVCIMSTGVPDINDAVVKADKKQRVHWKSHGGAYLVYFVESDWPFDDSADDTQTYDSVTYKIIKVPAGGDSNSFILTDELGSGETKRHPYRLTTDPPGTLPPPNGPAIVGEG